MKGIKVLATGRYAPDNLVTNEDFTKIVDTSDEWITTRTGMKIRHISDGEPTWMMASKAAKHALDNAGISAEEIDMLLVTTITGDFYSPSVASMVQREIGAFHAFGMDLNAACSGFVYGMDTAYRYLLTGAAKKVLLISAETLSKITDYTDRSTCVLFGDGAAAAVLALGDGIYSSYLAMDAHDAHVLYARTHDNLNPFSTKGTQHPDGFTGAKDHFLYMDGRAVYKFAVKAMPEAVERAVEQAGLSLSDIDYIIPHQANIRIVQTAAKTLGLPMEKFLINVAEYGNTSSASVPLCLDEYNERGTFHPGDKIVVVGFGAGLTYAAAVFEW